MTESKLDELSTPDQAPPSFDTIPLSPEVRRAVRDLGFESPTPVQKAVFLPASQGLDLVVQARTGTGKTAAFGLPIIDRLVDPALDEPQVLILAPTRELALQISRELEALAKYKQVRCTAVYGGAAMQPQIDALRGGAQVIAGTPGRVLDHLERGTLDPETLQLLVLDESDEMLSMGFLPQITKIMELLPKPFQTLLFSATVPPDVKRIAETRLDHPQFITLSGDHIGALSIDHFVYRSRGAKSEELVQLIEVENPESAIVFCNTREQTKRVAGALQRAGYSADWLNADLSQSDREKVMAATRQGKLRFLVATDVAARGIDISHLTHVINADFPESTENYVHRTGRTGRAGRTGTAISLIAPQDVGNLYMLRLTYKIFPVERELPSARELQTRKETDLLGFLTEAFEGHPRPDDLSLARRILASPSAETIVAGLLRDHLGAHPHAAGAAAQQRRDGKKPPAESSNEPPEKKVKAERLPMGDRSSRTNTSSASPSADRASTDRPSRDRTAAPERDAARDRHESEGWDGSDSKKDKKRKKKEKEKKREKKLRAEGAPLSSEEDFASEDGASAKRPEAPTASPTRSVPRVASAAPRAGSTGPRAERELEVVSAADILGGHIDDLLDELVAPPDEAPSRQRKASRPTPEEGGASPPRSRDASVERAAAPEEEMAADGEGVSRIFVNVGRNAGVRARDLRSVLAEGGIHPDDIEQIAVKDRHSFVLVVDDLLDEAIDLLSGATFGDVPVRAERARARR